MNIWHISDTHCRHKELIVPDLEKIDLIIHTGDASNNKKRNVIAGTQITVIVVL